MQRNPYSAGAVKFSFWFQEFRKAVFMLADGASLAEIKKLSQETNIFAASSPERAKLIMSNVAKRIEALDPSFIPLFVCSDVVGQKVLCLIACMCTDTLFFDFVNDIIRVKLALGLNEYGDSDARKFWDDKQIQSDKVANLTEATRKRLLSTYKQYLYNAGITDGNAGSRKIIVPIISADIVAWLREHDLQPILVALTGE